VCPITDEGLLDLDALQRLFSPRTRLVAVAHVSNVLGTINPVQEIIRMAHAHGVPVLIGPNNKGFREAQDLLRMGGCFEITGPTLFNAVADRLVDDHALRHSRGEVCRNYIVSNAGASDVIFKTLGLS